MVHVRQKQLPTFRKMMAYAEVRNTTYQLAAVNIEEFKKESIARTTSIYGK
jgi:hypothetical protein